MVYNYSENHCNCLHFELSHCNSLGLVAKTFSGYWKICEPCNHHVYPKYICRCNAQFTQLIITPNALNFSASFVLSLSLSFFCVQNLTKDLWIIFLFVLSFFFVFFPVRGIRSCLTVSSSIVSRQYILQQAKVCDSLGFWVN